MSLPFFKRKSNKSRPVSARKRPTFRTNPIEQLEDRTVPAAFVWDGGASPDTSWDNPVNWDLDAGFPAAQGDTASFDAGSANVTITGTVSPDSVSFAVGSNFDISGGTLSLATGVVHSGGANTIGSIIGGAGALTVSNGTLTLTGANSYSGVTNIDGGVLSLSSGGGLGDGTRNINSGGTLEINNFTHDQPLNLNASGTLRGIGANARENGSVTIADGAVTIGTGASATDVFTIGDGDNDLTGGGATGTLTIAGAGKVVLAGDGTPTNNFLGTLKIDGGVLSFNGTDAILGNVNNDFTLNSGTLQVTGGPWSPATTRVFTVATASTLDVTAGTTTFGFASQMTLNAKLTQTQSTGSGTVKFTAAGTGIGGYQLSSGTLQVGVASPIGTTGTLTLAGGKISSDGVTARIIASPLAITGSVTIGDSTNNGALTFNTGTETVTGSNTITLAGGTVTFAALDLGAGETTFTGPANLAQTGVWTSSGGGIAFNSGYSGTVTLNQNNSFNGGVTVNSGTVNLNSNTVGSVTTGPVGTGTLTLTGGTIQTTNDNRTFANALAITGPGTITFNSSGVNRAMTFTGGVTVSGSPTVDFIGASSNITFNTSALVLNSNLLITGTLGNAVAFTGGINTGGFNRTITNNKTGGTFTHSGDFTGAASTVELAGSSSVLIGPLTGSTAHALLVTGTGTYTFSGASDFTGGVTVNSGTINLNSNTTGSVTNGPVGTGLLTIAGGVTVQNTAGNQTYANALALNGPGTITFTESGTNRAMTFSGDVAVSGSPTVNLTSTGTNNSAITFNATTWTMNSDLTIEGLKGTSIPGQFVDNNGVGSNSLTIYNRGGITLTNAAGNQFSAVIIGENVSSGSRGGSLTVNSQNALSTAPVNINYGGTLTQSATFNPSNVITVQSGGTYTMNGNNANPNVTVNSGGTLGGANTAFAGTLNVPAGVLFSNAAITSANNLPTLTGTLAFGGAGAFTINPAGTTPVQSQSGAGRIAFNNTAGTTFTDGINLNGDITVRGSGSAGLTGLVPTGASGALGAITQTGTRNITVAMAPAGMASVTGSANWVDTTINSGTLLVNTANPGTGTTTIDGGVLRLGTTISKAIAVGTDGGAIEAGNQTYSGNLSGSTSLVARGVGGNLTLSGDNSGFTGGLTVAAAGAPGTVFFTGANSLGGSGAITVGKGLAFGGTAVNTGSYANFSRFSTANVDAVYNVSNNDAAPNLSSTNGLNRDVWVGLSGTNITGYTLPDGGSTYKIVPIAATTLSSTNVLTGANNLIVSAGAVPTDSNSSATNVLGAGISLTVSGAQNYSGSTTVHGTTRNALMGGGNGAPTLVAQNNLSTSSVLVDRSGIFTLSAATGLLTRNTGSRSITVTGGGTFNDGLAGTSIANRIDTGFDLNLGGTNGGGTFNVVNTATVDQALASLAVNAGSSAIGLTNATLTFASPTIARTVGGTLALPATGVTLTGASATNVLGGWAFVGTNFAAVNGSAQIIASAPSTNDINTASGDFQNTNAGVYTLTGLQTVNSIYLNTTTNAISTSTFGLTVASGGIIRAQNVAINSGAGGTLTSSYAPSAGVRELILNDTIAGGNNGPGANIAPQIVQDGGFNITLTKLGGGNPVFTNSANQIADIYANGGRIEASAIGALGQVGTSRTLNLLGGSVHFGHAGANYANTSVVVGPQGGGLNGIGSAASPVVVGSSTAPVTLNGQLNIKSGSAASFLTLAGDITGPGAIEFNGRGSGSNVGMTLELTGDNSAWSGGIQTGSNNGGGSSVTAVRFGKGASSGTGPLLTNGGGLTIGSLYFDTTATTNSSYVNDIRVGNSAPLVVLSQGTGLSSNRSDATSATFSGRLISTAGLTVQGYATADDATSEIILAGPVTVSGSNAATNFGTTTVVQNFSNGQGGITLGTIGSVTLPSGTANNGAEGFVRFSGVNSFIPGAVGPGYLSAIRKAGGGADGRFGYLLTGTASGTTYSIPEGKSFLIGSLGAGTQQFGTLGVASDNAGAESATLLGGAKHNNHSAGELLAGFNGGDVNIHATAAGDSQSLNLFARAADDTFILGSGTPAENVVFTPTYGDSGATSSITLMQKRTGATTLNKTGDGTLEFSGVNFTNTDGTDARGNFTLNVNAGTLKVTQTDSDNSTALKVNVNASTILSGTGRLDATTTLADSAAVSSTGTLTLGGAVAVANASTASIAAGTLSIAGTSSIDGTLNGPGTVNVAASGTLGGTGTVNADVAVQGKVSPGNSVGILSAGNVTFKNGSKFYFEGAGDEFHVGNLSYDNAGSDSYRIEIAPNLPLNTAMTFLTWTGSAPTTPAANWTVAGVPLTGPIHWTAGSGAWDFVSNWDGAGVSGTVTQNGNSLQITILSYNNAKPEIGSDVFITPTAGPTVNVTGATAATTVNSLTIGGNGPINLALGGPSLGVTNASTIQSDSQINVNSGSFSTGTTLTVNGTLNNAATTSISATGAATATGTLGISGGFSAASLAASGTITFNNNATVAVPTLTVTGGTTTYNTGNAVSINTVNANGGTLALSSGTITAPSLTVGASGGLQISAALTGNTLFNTAGTTTLQSGSSGTIPTLNVTAGTTTLGNGTSASITIANLSGGSLLINGGSVGSLNITGNTLTTTAGSITTLNVQNTATGTHTVGSGTTLGSASVAGGTVNLNNTNQMSSLTITGGTTTLGNGANLVGTYTLQPTAGTLQVANSSAAVATIGKGDFSNYSSGNYTVNTQQGALAVTTQLKLPDNITMDFSSGTSFAVNGSNIADNAAARTVTVSGGILTLGAGGGGSAAPTAGLLRHYTFDDAANSGFNDSSANNIAGASSGTIARTTSEFKYGAGAMSFNAGSYFIPGPAGATLPSTGWTFTTWFKGNNTNSYRTLLHGGSTYGANNAYVITSSSGTSLGTFDNGSWAGVNGDHTAAANVLPTDTTTWHFLAATYDGSTLRYYVDGVTTPVATLTLKQARNLKFDGVADPA